MKTITLFAAIILCCNLAFAQTAPAGTEMEIIDAYVAPTMEIIQESESNFFLLYKTPYYDGTVLKDPVEIRINKTNTTSINVTYSLYTYKQKYLHDKGLDAMNRFGDCIEQKNQADIDKNLDKIYEFPVITEVPSESERILKWDGRTDAKFTGKSLPVRARIHLAVHNADNGELITIRLSEGVTGNYWVSARVEFLVNKDKDGKETLSAKLTVALDERPIKLTAFVATTSCGLGLVTYDMANKGTEAIIASINSSSGEGFYDIVAYIELTNPTPDPKDSRIKSYEWKDIKKINWNDQKWKDLLKNAQGGMLGYGGWPWKPTPILDGDYFAPVKDISYVRGFILEALDDEGKPMETYTGINEGYVSGSIFTDIPMLTNPKSIYTSLPSVIPENKNITIGQDGNNFHIICNNGMCKTESYSIYDLTGKTVKAGKLSGANEETISAIELCPGIYAVQIFMENGEKNMQKVILREN